MRRLFAELDTNTTLDERPVAKRLSFSQEMSQAQWEHSTATELPVVHAAEERTGPARSALPLSPPVWVPDDGQRDCTRCKSKFWLLVRRHHCRLCGRLFCHDCSDHFTPIPAFGWVEPVRVCRLCVDAYVEDVREEAAARGETLLLEEHPSLLNASVVSLRRLQQHRHRSQRPTPATAGLWVPDSSADGCFSCAEEFSLFLRRHHCRGCGQVFCSRCTHKGHCSNPAFAERLVLVCDSCDTGGLPLAVPPPATAASAPAWRLDTLHHSALVAVCDFLPTPDVVAAGQACSALRRRLAHERTTATALWKSLAQRESKWLDGPQQATAADLVSLCKTKGESDRTCKYWRRLSLANVLLLKVCSGSGGLEHGVYALNHESSPGIRIVSMLYLSNFLRAQPSGSRRAGDVAFISRSGVLSTLSLAIKDCLNEVPPLGSLDALCGPSPAFVGVSRQQERLLLGLGAARLLLALTSSSQPEAGAGGDTAREAGVWWRLAKVIITEMKTLAAPNQRLLNRSQSWHGMGRTPSTAQRRRHGPRAEPSLQTLRQLTIHDLLKAVLQLATRDSKTVTQLQIHSTDALLLLYMLQPVALQYHSRVCLKLLQELWQVDINVGAVFGCTVSGLPTRGAPAPGLSSVFQALVASTPDLKTATLNDGVLPLDCAEAVVEAAHDSVDAVLTTMSTASIIIPPTVPSAAACAASSMHSVAPGTEKGKALRRAALAALREGTRSCPRACVGVREADGLPLLSALLDSGDRITAETAAAIVVGCTNSDVASRVAMRRLGGVAAAVRRLGFVVADTAMGVWGILGPQEAAPSRTSSTRLAELCAGIVLNCSADFPPLAKLIQADHPTQIAVTLAVLQLPLQLLSCCATRTLRGAALGDRGEQCLRVVELCAGCLFNCAENGENIPALRDARVADTAQAVCKLLGTLAVDCPNNVRLRAGRVTKCLQTVEALTTGRQLPSHPCLAL